MMQTLAVLNRDEEGDHYVITGTKWFITGATGAGFAIIMARMEDGSATMFLADMAQKEIVIERQIDALDSCFTGGHGVVRFDGLRVPATDVLGELGQGFRYAQIRLAPARLTHCMRWLGQARRAHEVASEYAKTRQAFGQPLVEHEGVGFMLADNEMDLHSARLAIWHCAWVLDQGHKGRHESSVAKVLCSEAEWRVVDRSVQILGASGVSTRPSSRASSATCAPSASTTARARCTAGAWPRPSRGAACAELTRLRAATAVPSPSAARPAARAAPPGRGRRRPPCASPA